VSKINEKLGFNKRTKKSRRGKKETQPPDKNGGNGRPMGAIQKYNR